MDSALAAVPMLRFLLTSALLCVLAACTGAIGDAPDAAEVATDRKSVV